MNPVFAGALFARFLVLRKSKKGTLTDFRIKNDENFGLCLFYFSHFSTKEGNIKIDFFALKARFLQGPFFARFSTFLGAKKGPHSITLKSPFYRYLFKSQVKEPRLTNTRNGGAVLSISGLIIKKNIHLIILIIVEKSSILCS